jgi:hypothetical protein
MTRALEGLLIDGLAQPFSARAPLLPLDVVGNLHCCKGRVKQQKKKKKKKKN